MYIPKNGNDNFCQTWVENGLTQDLWFNITLWVVGLSLGVYRQKQAVLSIALKHHHAILQHVRKQIVSLQITDAVILATLSLMASEDCVSNIHKPFAGFKPALTSLQHLNEFGRYRMAELHSRGLRNLLEEMGGINQLSTVGVAQAVQV